MSKLQTKGLGGLIFSSPDPARLATFYREVIGIPLALNRHGDMPEHWECDHQGIHYAVLPLHEKGSRTQAVIPSFAVDSIDDFLTGHQLESIHPIMKLDEGKYIATITDVDGNPVRLWMDRNAGREE